MLKKWCITLLITSFFTANSFAATMDENPSLLEKNMSDTLDIWRDGRYEQLFDQLAHRGKTTKEKFVTIMKDAKTRPACCWQKIENFKVLSEKRTEATVYAKVGLEGGAGGESSMTREFKLTHQEGVWKMQLADIMAMSGANGKKKSSSGKHHSKNNSPYKSLK